MCGRDRACDGRGLAGLSLNLFGLDLFGLGGRNGRFGNSLPPLCRRTGDDDDFGRNCGFHDSMD